MRLGKIDYLNLVPFDVFLKQYPANLAFKKFVNFNKSYPSKINRDFLFRRVDAGFISSIAGYESAIKKNVTNIGIISRGEVWSVLVLPKDKKDDYQSASSNALMKILNLNGEVLIGDRALRYKLEGKDALDMGKIWYERERIPFVFGRLCFNKHIDFYKKVASSFSRKKVKIPHYMLIEFAKKSSVKERDIVEYLKKIYYKIGTKEEAGMKRFYRHIRIKKIKKPSRF